MKTQVIFRIYDCTYQILAGRLRFPLEGKTGDLHVAEEMITCGIWDDVLLHMANECSKYYGYWWAEYLHSNSYETSDLSDPLLPTMQTKPRVEKAFCRHDSLLVTNSDVQQCILGA